MVARPRLGLPHDLCDDDVGPLLISWMIAIAAAAAWLMVVHLTPSPMAMPIPVDLPVPPIGLEPDFGLPRTANPRIKIAQENGAHVVRQQAPTTLRGIAQIFAAAVAAAPVAEVTKMIPGEETVRADASTRTALIDKTALSTGAATATPGMTKLGAGSAITAGANLGSVQRSAGVARATFHAQPLPTVTAPAPDGTIVDATELGSFVRGRVAQLQGCYALAGGTTLAGVVAVQITLGAGGTVRVAEITRRTWSGPGAAETEACLLRVIGSWRLPSGSEGAKVTLPISFTRG